MFQIKDLLDKFRAIQDPKKIKQGICDVLNKETGINYLKPEMVELKKHIIWLKVNPAIRQKIFMQKAPCLEVLKQSFPEEFIVDIK